MNWFYQKMSITKNVLLNWCLTMKKEEKKRLQCFWCKKLTLKVQFWHFLTLPYYTNSQNSITSFGRAKAFPKEFWNVFLVSSLSSKIRRKTSRKALKVNLFVQFLEEPLAWKNLFKFVWPVILYPRTWISITDTAILPIAMPDWDIFDFYNSHLIINYFCWLPTIDGCQLINNTAMRNEAYSPKNHHTVKSTVSVT